MLRIAGIFLLALVVVASGRVPWCCSNAYAPKTAEAAPVTCSCCCKEAPAQPVPANAPCGKCPARLLDERSPAKVIALFTFDHLAFHGLLSSSIAPTGPREVVRRRVADWSMPPPEPGWLRHGVLLI